MDNNELYHHGVKGQKWGVRRYQNKDGTLTKAGQRRYTKEVEKLKSEKKVVNNKIRTRKKLDKLDDLRKEVEDKKKALKEAEDPKTKKTRQMSPEEIEAKKEKVLNSRSAKELYNNADLFTSQELQNAYNRLNTENNIKNLIPNEVSAGEKFVNKTINTGRKINDLTDVGIKGYNNFAKLYNSLSSKGRENPLPIIKDNDQKKKLKSATIKTKKDSSDDTDTNNDSNSTNDSANQKQSKKTKEKVYTGDVEGTGTSTRRDTSNKKTNSDDVIIDAEWSEVNSDNESSGRDFVNNILLLEDKSK